MGYKFIVYENKGKTGYLTCATRVRTCGNLGFRRAKVSLPSLVQQSRALYSTRVAKVKRQKENGLLSLNPDLPFAVFLSAFYLLVAN
jgi:hypothetical protein